ncbi:sensor histidine kinase [Nonomuraea candida]|uniref:sensor histidine kinase n=1 Tax=Nonomuraea candida TaxID=359159 RepID=UPI0005BE9360|nr:histidine kinase [Nonomuraea candida]
MALEQRTTVDRLIIVEEWALVVSAFFIGGALTASVVHRMSRVRLLRAQQAAVLRERRRVARNLHDGVSHGLVVMALHARRLRSATAGASHHQAAEIIEGVARTTLADLSATLGVLRSEESATALPRGALPLGEEQQAPPAPFSSRLLQLTRHLPASRLDLELHDLAEEHRVPPGVAAAAFRVAQEVLTNALKHNGGRLHLEVRFGDELSITLTNDARPPGGKEICFPPGGFGLAGLREHLEVHGGLLEARPLPGGGFVTRATIPITREDDVCTASAC